MGVSNFDPRPDVKEGVVKNLDAVCPITMADPKGTSKCIWSKCGAYRVKCSLTVDNASRVPGGGQRIRKYQGYCGIAGEP